MKFQTSLTFTRPSGFLGQMALLKLTNTSMYCQSHHAVGKKAHYCFLDSPQSRPALKRIPHDMLTPFLYFLLSLLKAAFHPLLFLIEGAREPAADDAERALTLPRATLTLNDSHGFSEIFRPGCIARKARKAINTESAATPHHQAISTHGLHAEVLQ